jgi:hypothetical protein
MLRWAAATQADVAAAAALTCLICSLTLASVFCAIWWSKLSAYSLADCSTQHNSSKAQNRSQ